MLITKLNELLASPSQAESKLPDLEGEYQTATPAELIDAYKAIKEAQKLKSDALQPEQWQKLIGVHQTRVKEVASSGAVGVYSGPLARFEAEKYTILKRETAGLFPGTMPDFGALTAQVIDIVTRAKANAAGPAPELDVNKFAPLAKRLLGLNTGSDQISEVVTYRFVDQLRFDAFDHAGYHVMFGSVSVADKSLYVDLLKASHGRNVEDLVYGQDEVKMPGRGNTRAIAEALNGAVDCALDAGFSTLSCTPGNGDVAQLYAKMGFVRQDGNPTPAAGETMTLDLSNEQVVQQMSFVFCASRAGITDVPKNVPEKMLAKNQPLNPPLRHLREWPFERETRRANFVLTPQNLINGDPGSVS